MTEEEKKKQKTKLYFWLGLLNIIVVFAIVMFIVNLESDEGLGEAGGYEVSEKSEETGENDMVNVTEDFTEDILIYMIVGVILIIVFTITVRSFRI